MSLLWGRGEGVLGVLGNRGAAEGKDNLWDCDLLERGAEGEDQGEVSEVSGWSHLWRCGWSW